MDTSAFGFAYPVKYDDVKPGMLISGRVRSGAQVFGLVIQGEREIVLGIFWTSEDQAVPFEVELGDVFQTLGQIAGRLEIEPSDMANPFSELTREMNRDGIYIGSDGKLGLSLLYEDWPGQKRRRYVRFEDGLADTTAGMIIFPKMPRLFIAQLGRKERIELPQ